MEIAAKHGLCPLSLTNTETPQQSSHKARKVDIYYQKWHDKIGHQSSERFQQKSNIYYDIPTFAR